MTAVESILQEKTPGLQFSSARSLPLFVNEALVYHAGHILPRISDVLFVIAM